MQETSLRRRPRTVNTFENNKLSGTQTIPRFTTLRSMTSAVLVPVVYASMPFVTLFEVSGLDAIP